MKATLRHLGLLAGAASLAGVIAILPAGARSSAAPSAPGTASSRVSGTTVYWAEQAFTTPNWIFPFPSLQYYSSANINDFQPLMYRPLFWLDRGGKPGLDEKRSLAFAPAISGSQVTIKLKGWKWSDGETVDAQNVVFFLNMLRAEKDNFAGYVPDELPDNLVSVSAASPTAESVTMTFDRSYNPTWLLLNELSQITPMPNAWDISGLQPNGQPNPPGSGGCSSLTWNTTVESACTAVWKLMTDNDGTSRHPHEAADLNTYATNPLWQVVDGPWRLTSFDARTGEVAMVPNAGYSGNDKPHFARFVELPFTTDTSELAALKRGSVTVGYLPIADAPAAPFPGGVGPNLPALASTYVLGPQYSWVVNYFPINFASRADGGFAGAIFRQLYLRQAMAMLVDQRSIIANAFDNYAVPGVGPVPTDPPTSFLSQTEVNYPYAYDPAEAVNLLAKHGWEVVRGGTDVCGAAAGCGQGVSEGALLSLRLVYASGSSWLAKTVNAEAAAWHAAGIAVSLKALPFNDVLKMTVSCYPTPTPACHAWDMADWGGGWLYAPDFDPTGEYIFKTGAVYNVGNYSDPRNDSLIHATIVSRSNRWFSAWENYDVTQVPVMWQPDPAWTLVEVAKGVRGVVANDALGQLTPEDWYNVASRAEPSRAEPSRAEQRRRIGSTSRFSTRHLVIYIAKPTFRTRGLYVTMVGALGVFEIDGRTQMRIGSDP